MIVVLNRCLNTAVGDIYVETFLQQTHVFTMATQNPSPIPASCPSETAAERSDRLREERLILSQAEADIDAGLGIDDDALEQWLDRLDHDETA